MGYDLGPIVRLTFIALGALAGAIFTIFMLIFAIFITGLSAYAWIPVMVGVLIGAVWPINS